MSAFQFFAYIESLATRADGAIKITMSTQELPGGAMAQLFELRGKEGYVAVIPGNTPIELTDIHVPEEEPEFPGQKSQNERTRNVMYLVWKHEGHGGDFDAWRRAEKERIIDDYKARLPERF